MKKWMVVLALLACAAFSRPVAAQTGDLHATVELKDTNGQSVGTAHLMQDGDAVHVTGSFRNLPPGAHGIHFHAVGTCEPDFAAAGGHYNPEGKQHGLENPAGAHAGDLPNLMINDDGTGSYDHKTMMVTLGSGPTTLYDADGTSIIIHAGPDDYKTDPAGNSGARIACGVVPAAQTAAPAPQPPASDTPATLPNTGSTSSILLLLAGALGALATGALVRRRNWA